MGKTATWQIPFPDLDDPADIVGVEAVDDLAQRVDTVLTQLRAAGSIPGEVKLWPGAVVPDLATYGRWAWADGAIYDTATYPLASANIAPAWRTAHGQADPGAGKFRAPDLRGLTPAGMDAMPGGARANRMTRAVAITIAARTGEELHTISVPEMPWHGHGVSDPTHAHGVADPGHAHAFPTPPLSRYLPEVARAVGTGGEGIVMGEGGTTDARGTGIGIYGAGTGIAINGSGGGGAHENVQPTVFVPWIVKLDD